MVYSDVCIRDTKNPVLMDTHYTASLSPERDRIPTFTGIVLRNVRGLTGGKITLEGYDEQHWLGMTFDNVRLDMPDAIHWQISHTDLTRSDTGSSNSCTDKFVPI